MWSYPIVRVDQQLGVQAHTRLDFPMTSNRIHMSHSQKATCINARSSCKTSLSTSTLPILKWSRHYERHRTPREVREVRPHRSYRKASTSGQQRCPGTRIRRAGHCRGGARCRAYRRGKVALLVLPTFGLDLELELSASPVNQLSLTVAVALFEKKTEVRLSVTWLQAALSRLHRFLCFLCDSYMIQ